MGDTLVSSNSRRATAVLFATLLAVAPVLAATVLAASDAVDDPYSTDEDVALTVEAPGLLTNDTTDAGTLCVTGFDTTGLEGSLASSGVTDGSFTYTPAANWAGTTSFTYTVAAESSGVCPVGTVEDTATVTITVNPVNDPPTAVADSFTALKDRTLNVAAPGVLGNDSDVDGDSLTAVKVNSPSHGVVTLASNGSFSYTPTAGYVGPDAFSYRASDGTASSPQRVVSLSVVTVPPPPTPTPAPTPTPSPSASPTPEPSATESPAPSDSGFVVPSAGPSESPAASPTAGPVGGPVSGKGGLPLMAVVALLLLVGLLAVAAVYFVRSQRTGEEEDLEPALDGDDRYDAMADDGRPNGR